MSVKYYEENASQYIDETINCDMSEQYKFFLKHLKNNAKILDVGFGSGRDMLYFKSLGFEVVGIDPCKAFCDTALTKGLNVINTYVEDIEFNEEFDGIRACASLLHVKRENLIIALNILYKSLKKDGVLYASFKVGNNERSLGLRYFNDLDLNLAKEIIRETKFSHIYEYNFSNDVRNNRDHESWINFVLKK